MIKVLLDIIYQVNTLSDKRQCNIVKPIPSLLKEIDQRAYEG